MDSGGHVDGDTDIFKGELGLDTDAGDAGGDAGVIRPGGDGDLLAYFELGVLAIGSTDAGVLEDACIRIRQKRVERAAGDADGKVGGIEMSKRVEGEVGGRRGCAGCRGASSSSRRRGTGLWGEANRLRQGETEVAHLVAIDFENRYIDHHFGAGSVKVVDELLGEEKLIWRGAHHDSVLTGNEINFSAGVEKVTNGSKNFVGIVLLTDVGEIKGLDSLLVEFGSFGAGVLGDEDGIAGDGLVKGIGDGADNAQGVRQSDIGEIDGDAFGGVVGVEENVESGQLSNGLIDDFGVFDRMESDGVVRDWLELDGTCYGVKLFDDLRLRGGFGGYGERSNFGPLGVLKAINLLLRGLVGRIDLEGTHELTEGATLIVVLKKNTSLVDVTHGCLEHHAI